MDISGSKSINLPLDQELIVQTSKTFGDKKCNVTTGAFVAGNMRGEPPMSGVFAELINERSSWSVQLSKTVKLFHSLSFAFGMELYNSDTHILTFDGMGSFIKLVNGVELTRESFGFGYKHAQGHNAQLAISHVGKYNMITLTASAKASIWSSRDNATTLELTGSASYHLRGPYAGAKKFGGGLGFTHRF